MNWDKKNIDWKKVRVDDTLTRDLLGEFEDICPQTDNFFLCCRKKNHQESHVATGIMKGGIHPVFHIWDNEREA